MKLTPACKAHPHAPEGPLGCVNCEGERLAALDRQKGRRGNWKKAQMHKGTGTNPLDEAAGLILGRPFNPQSERAYGGEARAFRDSVLGLA